MAVRQEMKDKVLAAVKALPERERMVCDLAGNSGIRKIRFNPSPFTGQVPETLRGLLRRLLDVGIEDFGPF